MMLQEPLRIGIIGTDTSHAIAFTRMINDVNDHHYVPGGKVVAAYPGGSSDFPLSASRVDGFMETLEKEFGVARVGTLEALAWQCDAYLLLSADGRVHLEQLRAIVPCRKPVFIDKPLALSIKEAKSIFELANQWDVPIMSSSSLRFLEPLVQDLDENGRQQVTAASVQGSLAVEPTQSRYFWYAIHAVELLYAIMGPGCREVRAERDATGDRLVGVWQDGRIGEAICRADGDDRFLAQLDRSGVLTKLDAAQSATPFYASLMAKIIPFLQTGRSPVHWRETVEIIVFLEAAEKSLAAGGTPQPVVGVL
ncbi:Gfo/Idh/MocA family protein [Paenibacillus sp. NPDC057967]|uniref:Gfo/Idh/MocA family protein n=1 Tax=Paenibacillus sp. NPDC057967 TaxID=3346293 RepID=UPI0036DBB2D8